MTRKKTPAKSAAKTASKSAAKTATKGSMPKPSAKKPSAKTETKPAKPAPAKPVEVKAAAPAKPAPGAPPAAPGSAGRKGITVVSPKPIRKPKPKPSTAIPPGMSALGKSPAFRKPLIPSGPKANPSTPLGAHGAPTPETPAPVRKTPYGKKELEQFRSILLRKRAELIGDVVGMENQALKGESGSLSSLPQHIAEQGSDAYDQSLALDIAAQDRKLIKEIDDALKRIEDGTYGVCELTGKPIKPERLEELPWARYSIEAARELERRSMRL